ncbi:hypothetical protein NC653_022751 [Populus alba x Populus x berolinensis]|uniref:Uncharacterized protein n=1 Tax=Populus alba x Populus x berolinensis TaxID=444605 RepID=A0AAD6MFN2_9ROSI|nr:hypothetical protein NC653_022751 [Populus alba x Populus x berolinensis]
MEVLSCASCRKVSPPLEKRIVAVLCHLLLKKLVGMALLLPAMKLYHLRLLNLIAVDICCPVSDGLKRMTASICKGHGWSLGFHHVCSIKAR